MAKLIVNPTSPARRDVPLPRTVLSIGRDPSNDLVLPDAMVSRRHALVECRGTQYFLRDCNSSNGSLVNGDRISERGLRDGDLVAIGTVRLMFREEAEPLEPGAKVVQHPSAPRLVCPGCQADYRKGDLFCRQCGERLQDAPPRAVCTTCGTAVLLPARFCNACGALLGKEGSAESPTAQSRPVADQAADEATRPREREQDLGAAAPSAEGKLREAASGREPSAATPSSGAAMLAVAPAQPPPMPERESRPVPPPLRAVPIPSRQPAGPGAAPELLHRTTYTVESRPPAGPGVRLLASLIDAALVGAAQLVVLAPGILYWRSHAADPAGPSFLPVLVSVSLGLLALLVGAGYYVAFWGLRGATPGKRLLGLSLYGLEGHFPVGVKRAGLRLLGYLLSGAALGLGFVVILFGATSLHDRLARTVVVKERAPRPRDSAPAR
jgi:uncharacterized RDD family membrane protein YckC